ncbi:MAG: tyrosine-type recombinase/integrase [Pseudomonadota bacterium]
MLQEELFPKLKGSEPWNKGKLVGQRPPLKLNEIWAIRIRLQLQKNLFELALFNLAIDSKLRACDLVALKVSDLFKMDGVVSRAMILQRKTQLPVQFEVTAQTRDSISALIAIRRLNGDDHVFQSRSHSTPHLSTRQYSRIVKKWVFSIGLDPKLYGTHSIRRTKPSLIYKRTKNLRAVQLLLGHTKLESTIRYLGVEVDDALELAEATEA